MIPESTVIVRPGDIRYPDLVRGNNQRWVGSPQEVHLPADTAGVVASVQDAVDGARRLSVRSGGHCYMDLVFNAEVQLVVDLTRLNNVYYDETMDSYVIEAGSSLAHAYTELFKRWGKSIPAGRCLGVAAGGHISGGGYGMLSRGFGLSVDHVYGVEVVLVDADGRARAQVATRDSDDGPLRELWWANSGAGACNFGIITKYFMRSPGGGLMTPPAAMLFTQMVVPYAEVSENRLVETLAAWGDWHEREQDPDAPTAGLSSLMALGGDRSGWINVLTMVNAEVPGAAELERDFRARVIGAGTIVESHRLPWLLAVRYMETNEPGLTNPTLRESQKSAYFRTSMTSAQARSIYRNLSDELDDHPASTVALVSYGARVNAVGRTETAVAQRDSIFKMMAQASWSDAGDDQRNRQRLRRVYGDIFATTGGYPPPNGDQTDGCFVNYCDEDIADPTCNKSGFAWDELYYGENLPRLKAAKARLDPLNIYRHRQSIQP